jgi:hypothetical protein
VGDRVTCAARPVFLAMSYRLAGTSSEARARRQWPRLTFGYLGNPAAVSNLAVAPPQDRR